MANYTVIGLLVTDDFDYGRKLLSGIHRYAETQRNWLFHRARISLTGEMSKTGFNAEGYLAHVASIDIMNTLRKFNCPIVNTSSMLAEQPFPTVTMDNRAIGKMAAEYFLERGYWNCWFYGSGGNYARERAQGFVRHLAEYDIKCEADHSGMIMKDIPAEGLPATHPILQRLISLPKPVGILTSNDESGYYLANVCRQAGLSVPEEVAIIGVNNDMLHCYFANPPLSSIDINGERIGYKAAELLDHLLQGEAPPHGPVLIPPSGVITRRSSDTHAINDPDVATAVHYISTHLSEAVTMDDILAHVPIRLRALEYRFQRTVGHTLLEEIRHARIKFAKELLVSSELSMAQIAKSCGLSNQQYFSTTFRKVVGCTPMSYRRGNRKHWTATILAVLPMKTGK